MIRNESQNIKTLAHTPYKVQIEIMFVSCNSPTIYLFHYEGS
jgi:hypothetical protein